MFDLIVFICVNFESFAVVAWDLFELDFRVGHGLLLARIVSFGASIAELGFAIGLGFVSFGVDPADSFAVRVGDGQFICNFIRHHYQLYIFSKCIKFNEIIKHNKYLNIISNPFFYRFCQPPTPPFHPSTSSFPSPIRSMAFSQGLCPPCSQTGP